MTAEIAILNKTAVALASDSAVTISTGDRDEKVYDSADKLFKLSNRNPIGIMIYSGMSFMEAPLPMIICEYRDQCPAFPRVWDAGAHLLKYLCEWGGRSSKRVADQILEGMIQAVFDRIQGRINEGVESLFRQSPLPGDFAEALAGIRASSISIFFRILSNAPAAEFVGEVPKLTKARKEEIQQIVGRVFPPVEGDDTDKIYAIAVLSILKAHNYAPWRTGVVIAGFATEDIFPSLVAYDIDGMVFGSLKFRESEKVDIDRDGERARVLPFAQKEMVERFLYGIDEDIERKIGQFCSNTLPAIRKAIFDHIEAEPDDLASLQTVAAEAEAAFMESLKSTTFEQIRSDSQSDIENMVEFMPKPELATMAEALVDLTSIKRRVSRGMQTVGGPIDVAIISRSEGFIWVKRKHYFSPELNPAYMTRVKRIDEERESSNAAKPG